MRVWTNRAVDTHSAGHIHHVGSLRTQSYAIAAHRGEQFHVIASLVVYEYIHPGVTEPFQDHVVTEAEHTMTTAQHG